MNSNLIASEIAGPPAQRVLLYPDDAGGARRLRRYVAMATQLVASTSRVQVVLVTGHPMRRSLRVPRGVSVLRLPRAAAGRTSGYSPQCNAVVRRARSAIIADVTRRFEPDVVMVDRAMQEDLELMSAVAALARRGSPVRVLMGQGTHLGHVPATPRSWSDPAAPRGLDRVAA